MSNTPIKKSFLFKISPPFVRSLAPPNLLNVPNKIVSNYCSSINEKLIKTIKKRRALLVNEYLFSIDKTHFSIGSANRCAKGKLCFFELL